MDGICIFAHLPFQAVRAFTLSPTAATAHIAALNKLTSDGAVRKVVKAAPPGHPSWPSEALAACEKELAVYVEGQGLKSQGANTCMGPREWCAAAALHAAGEVTRSDSFFSFMLVSLEAQQLCDCMWQVSIETLQAVLFRTHVSAHSLFTQSVQIFHCHNKLATALLWCFAMM